MIFSIPKQNVTITGRFFRDIGYISIPSSKAGKASFIRRIHSTDFPRFHLYVSQSADAYNFDLHMDLLRPQHKITARASENSTEPVKQEALRIVQVAKNQY